MTDEMELVQDWLDGKLNWTDIPKDVQDAIDEVMSEMPEVQEETEADKAAVETPSEEPFTAEIVKQTEELELVHKADSTHRFTLGPWYIPDRYDAHGEWTTADELQKSLWEYVKSGDRGIRLQHNKDIVAGEWLEAMSFPVPITIGMSKDAISKQVSYPAGTVFLGVQWKPWAWELVKAGKIQGFSIGGAAARIDMGMTDALTKASFATRSEAGRYAANQRWQGVSGGVAVGTMALFATVQMRARVAAARDRKEEREKAGEKTPSLVERLKRYFSEEYTNPESWVDLARKNDARIARIKAKARRSTNSRSKDVEMVALPRGGVAVVGAGKVVTYPPPRGLPAPRVPRVSKSVGQLKAEMRVNAAVAESMEKVSFSDASERGRYAANIRWKDHVVQGRIAEFAGSVPLPKTAAGKKAAKLVPSLVSHVDLDALTADLKKHGGALDDFQTADGTKVVEIVYKHLSEERKVLWSRTITHFVDERVPSTDKPVAIVLGGGAASGKSSPSEGLTLPRADPSKGQFEAVLSNPDEVKQLLPEYKALIGDRAEREATLGTNKAAWEEAAGLVHEESSLISQLIIGAALKQGKTVLIDGVADNGIKKQYTKLESYRKDGATRIDGVFFSTEIDEAVKRSKKRELDQGRRVKVGQVIAGHKGVSNNFPSYITDGRFDSMKLYDTNAQTPEGKPLARLTYDSTNRTNPMINQALYDQFLAKKDYEGKP